MHGGLIVINKNHLWNRAALDSLRYPYAVVIGFLSMNIETLIAIEIEELRIEKLIEIEIIEHLIGIEIEELRIEKLIEIEIIEHLNTK